ncbi:unnamed protein product [Sphenostylis stenocarpa]|uniref:Uncharacterized protein n=1 Tax=Sphenostylis stenocarpa TaxID=92480 RepID=A0AA86VUQ2_9FABA|nr:unnamed protein product [Sphenostylis stenocarpa]
MMVEGAERRENPTPPLLDKISKDENSKTWILSRNTLIASFGIVKIQVWESGFSITYVPSWKE